METDSQMNSFEEVLDDFLSFFVRLLSISFNEMKNKTLETTLYRLKNK